MIGFCVLVGIFWTTAACLVVPTEVDFDTTFSTSNFQRSSELVKIDVGLKANLCDENSHISIVVRETACTIVSLDYLLPKYLRGRYGV